MERFYLQVGQIVKPHGVNGELGVLNLTERPDMRFVPGNSLLAGPDERRLERLLIETARPYRQGFLVRFQGVDDRNEAEAMRGWGLFIESSEAAEPEPDRWYHHDLVGMRLVETDGREAGVVVAVVELPGHDLLEVRSADGRRFMTPMVREIVREVDLEAGIIKVSLPEGLQDL